MVHMTNLEATTPQRYRLQPVSTRISLIQLFSDKAAPINLTRTTQLDVDLIRCVCLLSTCGTRPLSCLQKVNRSSVCPWYLQLFVYVSVLKYKPGLR